MLLPRSFAPAPRVPRHLRVESFFERHARLLFPIPFALLTALLCVPLFIPRYPSSRLNRVESDVGAWRGDALRGDAIGSVRDDGEAPS